MDEVNRTTRDEYGLVVMYFELTGEVLLHFLSEAESFALGAVEEMSKVLQSKRHISTRCSEGGQSCTSSLPTSMFTCINEMMRRSVTFTTLFFICPKILPLNQQNCPAIGELP